MVTIFRQVLLVYRRSSEPFTKGLALGMLAGCAGLLAHGIGANTFIIVRIMEPFWFVTAMVILLPYLDESTLGKEKPEGLSHP
jgi:hypothetical protein